MSDWLGLALTDKAGNRLTDDAAIAYAAKHFGVDESQIELERDNTIIRVRVLDEDVVDIPTFDEWLQETYGTPEPKTELYRVWKKFGYGNYLIHAYPEIFATNGITLLDIYGHQRHLYYWQCVNLMVGNAADDEATEQQLLDLIDGLSLIRLTSNVAVPGVVMLEQDTLGVPIWDETNGLLCLFCLEDDLILAVIQPHEHEALERTFVRWEDLDG